MKQNRNFFLLLSFLLSLVGAGILSAMEPTAEEMARKGHWVSAKFDGQTPPAISDAETGIMVIQNYEYVRQNVGYGGKIKIKDTVYESGIMSHAYSKLRIRLPKPGKRFTAFVGIDNNLNIGEGEVQFFVKDSEEKILFQSDAVKGNKEPIPVDVDLSFEREFFLEVSELGNISCDQAVWADAKIELEDGSFIRLGEMPVYSDIQSQTYETDYPFSFVYGGKSSRDFLKSWKIDAAKTESDGKTVRTLVFTEPDGPLRVTCTATDYADFPTVEWVLTFKNTSDADTPLIENIQAVDTIFSVDSYNKVAAVKKWDPFWGPAAFQVPDNAFLLHHSVGSPCAPNDYMPLQDVVKPGTNLRIATVGGRSTNSDLPYFNLQINQEGWIVVLGWPGQWAANFKALNEKSLQMTAGQETTRFKLLPGEEVRSPRAVVQPWIRENWIDAQNVWRSWMIRHNVPRDSVTGKVVDHHLSGCSSHWFNEMGNADEKSQITFIDRYLEEKIPIDYWWMDAGWYPCGGNWPTSGGSWPITGTWEVAKDRFPRGFRPITDHGRENGIKTIVWFEPERVAPGTWLTENRPEWILGGAEGGLLNMGNPETVDWLIEHIDALIKREGIDLYRQDFNIDPLAYWQKNDAPDRQGISEIKHIEGYLRYWDALLTRNPGLRIDSCASGGRRNDLETIRRAVPLWRTDYICNACSNQTHTYGISIWIPFHGTGFRSLDDYGIRSAFVPYCNYLYDLRDESLDYETIRKNVKIWHETVVPQYCSDYYPLTPISTENNQWIGWQFNDQKSGTGIVQMFRRPESTFVKSVFKLNGLDESASYELKDVDSDKTWTVSGKCLTQDGLEIEIPQAPTALIWSYKKVGK